MTDEFNSEEKEHKSEKEVERVDKEFLSKAKNSRDMIDKKLRTFEDTIDIFQKQLVMALVLRRKRGVKKKLMKLVTKLKKHNLN